MTTVLISQTWMELDVPAIVELLAAGFHEELADPPVGELLAVGDRTHLVGAGNH